MVKLPSTCWMKVSGHVTICLKQTIKASTYLGGGFKYLFIFTPTWGHDAIWLILFKWYETTNQIYIDIYTHYSYTHPFFWRIAGYNPQLLFSALVANLQVYSMKSRERLWMNEGPGWDRMKFRMNIIWVVLSLKKKSTLFGEDFHFD